MRFQAARPLLLLLMVVSLVVSPIVPGPAPVVAAPVRTTATSTRPDLVEALAVLHAWDSRRARAWAAVDLAALRSLYVRGSGAGRADVRLLRAYAAHGFVVRRLVTQVFAVSVLHREPASVRLRVFDRIAGGVVVRDGHAVPLSSTRPVTRTVELRRVSGRWRVESVSGSGSGPRTARP